ncbi:linear amide C-N hydrolase [Candidatus Margulisiibacteriota bacterium]
MKFIYVIIGLVLMSFFNPIAACSEFFISQPDIKVAGRTMDFPEDEFFVIINPRSISRQAMFTTKQEDPVKWVSKYGSVTTNLFFDGQPQGPTDGLNEHGLSAALLWLDVSKYPENDERRVLDDGMWAQYCLDNFKTVDEVIAAAPKLRVKADQFFNKRIALHLYVHDAAGNSAVLEYLDGNLAIHHGQPLSVAVLTNDPYAENYADLQKYRDFGGKEILPGGYGSEARFVRAASYLKHLPKIGSAGEAVSLAFDGMADVSEPPSQSWPTQWTVVRDHLAKKYYFRSLKNANIRFVDLKKIDFSQGQPVRELDIKADFSGEVTDKFKPIKS